ncbi:MAG TPA: hypothetical protein VHE77_08965 [Dongiaceae bacterium]|jgi:hypothetical protein|nr:hypothetical protein [Dongiaceae bacterium]
MIETGAKANGALQNIGAMAIYQADRMGGRNPAYSQRWWAWAET